MIRSYCYWSAIMGVWYLVTIASLIAHPPGNETSVAIERGRYARVPEHVTFFQAAGVGSVVCVVVFGLLAMLLICAALTRWSALRAVHLTAMISCSVFGTGYVVSGVASGQAWLAGGFALVTAAAHASLSRLRKAAEASDVLAAAG